MISLYPDSDTYTIQLRALEQYCVTNPRSASARFVLAYHYLTQGNTSAAVGVLKQVVALQPNDALSAKLLRQLAPSLDKPEPASATAAAADPAPPQSASIEGAWTAQPAPGTSIKLAIGQDGKFLWQVTNNGKSQQFGGGSTYGNGILTLAQDAGPALVGRVTWKDPSHMTFRVAGEGPDDPGLSFAK